MAHKLEEKEANALFENTRAPRQCWNENCGNIGDKFCSRCRVAKYCSADCQKSHWKTDHKSKCMTKEKVSKSKPAPAPSSEEVTRLLEDIEQVNGENLSIQLLKRIVRLSSDAQNLKKLLADENTVLIPMINMLVDTKMDNNCREQAVSTLAYVSAHHVKIFKRHIAGGNFSILENIFKMLSMKPEVEVRTTGNTWVFEKKSDSGSCSRYCREGPLGILFNIMIHDNDARLWMSAAEDVNSTMFVDLLLSIATEHFDADFREIALRCLHQLSEHNTCRKRINARVPDLVTQLLNIIQRGACIKVKYICVQILSWYVDAPEHHSAIVTRTTELLIGNCFNSDMNNQLWPDMRVAVLGVLANMSCTTENQIAMARPTVPIRVPGGSGIAGGGIIPFLTQMLDLFKRDDTMSLGIGGLLVHLLGPAENLTIARKSFLVAGTTPRMKNLEGSVTAVLSVTNDARVKPLMKIILTALREGHAFAK